MENLLKQIEGELSKFFDGGETGIDIEYMTSNSFTNEISHSLSLDELTVKCEIDENNKI